MALREGIKILDGVGGDTQWWTYGTGPGQELVGYYRVPVLETEHAMCPAGIVVADAGEAGPQTPRTYLKKKTH
jgi:hypothetical protein